MIYHLAVRRNDEEDKVVQMRRAPHFVDEPDGQTAHPDAWIPCKPVVGLGDAVA
jgi:hypothetical protein